MKKKKIKKNKINIFIIKKKKKNFLNYKKK